MTNMTGCVRGSVIGMSDHTKHGRRDRSVSRQLRESSFGGIATKLSCSDVAKLTTKRSKGGAL